MIGRYILPAEIFPILAETGTGVGGEIQLTDAVRTLIEDGFPVYAHRFTGRRHDAGEKLGYLNATVEVALERDDLGPEFRDYLRSLSL